MRVTRQWSLFCFFQQGDEFDVGGVREEVEGVEFGDFVVRCKMLPVAGEGFVVAGDSEDTLRGFFKEEFDYFWMETGTRWVNNNGVRGFLVPKCEVFGFTCDKIDVGDVVSGGVVFCHFNGFGFDFDTKDSSGLRCEGNTEKACTAVEVEEYSWGFFGEVFFGFVDKLLGHEGVGLKKGVGVDGKGVACDLLFEEGFTIEEGEFVGLGEVGYGWINAVVDGVCEWFERGNKFGVRWEFALGGDDGNHAFTSVFAFANDEIAKKTGVVTVVPWGKVVFLHVLTEGCKDVWSGFGEEKTC